MPETGDILGGKYRLLRLIGKGGMGVVFEAEHLELGKKVAIKVPTEELARAEKDLERFKREPRAAAATGHPGIIDIYDIGTCDGDVPYVVMELLDGQSLAELIATRERLEVSFAVYVIANVLSALQAAHTKKILHRDLKPDNVFLVETGSLLPAVRILDFGTSKILEGAKTIERLTESGALVGTPFYMAPEQMEDDVEIDNRVDIYAAGVLLYEMLTGELPFDAENIYALVRRVMDGEYAAPRELREDIPERLEAIVMRALSHNREDRFSSAAAMFQALVPFMDKDSRGRISVPEVLGKGVFLDDEEEAVDLSRRREDGETAQPTVREGARSARSKRRDESSGEPSSDFYEAPTVSALSGVRLRRRGPNRAVLLGVAFFLALGAGAAIFFVGPDGRLPDEEPGRAGIASAGTATTAATGAPDDSGVVSDDGGPTAAAPGADDAGPAAAETLVTLTLENVPEDAEVTLDGARISSTSLKLRPSQIAQRLVVRSGEGEMQELVTLDRDVTVDVARLAPAATAAKAPPRRTGGRGAPSARPARDAGAGARPVPTAPERSGGGEDSPPGIADSFE